MKTKTQAVILMLAALVAQLAPWENAFATTMKPASGMSSSAGDKIKAAVAKEYNAQINDFVRLATNLEKLADSAANAGNGPRAEFYHELAQQAAATAIALAEQRDSILAVLDALFPSS